MRIRHPDGIWEVPAAVWPGMLPKLDPEWVWVATDDSIYQAQAVLVTAPAHGMLLLLRLWKSPAAPAMCLRVLIKEAAKEALDRGMAGWLCMIGSHHLDGGVNVTELKLARMMLRFGGHHQPSVGLIGYGKLEDVCRKS